MSGTHSELAQALRLEKVIDSRPLRRGARVAAAPLRFVGFWLAVALPFLYLPLLYGGLEGERGVVFATLLGVHAVALVLGHDHRR